MATYYAIAAGGNWNTGATWSTISDKDVTRVGGATVPTIADTVVLDDYSGQVTVDSDACVCLVLDMTGYTSTMTFTATKKLTVGGNCTLVGTLAGTGTLCLGTAANVACALTLTQGAFPGSVQLSGSGIKTLSAAWHIAGSLTVVGVADVALAGNFDLTCAGLSMSVAKKLSGVTDLVLDGGTWSALGASSVVETNLSFAGAVTVSGNVYFKTGVLTHTSGTITTAGSTLNITGACTLNTPTASMTWANAMVAGAVTLSDGLTFGGNLYISATSSFAGAHTIVSSFVMGGAEGADLALTDATLSIASGYLDFLGSLVGLVTFSGTSSIGSINYGGGTITCTSGTTTAVSGTVLTVTANSTINTPTANLAWKNVTISGTTTVTLTAASSITGTLTVPTGGAATINTGTLALTGNMALTGTLEGTSVITMSSGTWTAASAAATLANSMVFGVNAIAKGTVYYKTGTLAYTNGTIHGGLSLTIT